MRAKAENRDQYVDIMRGIAMLLVVLAAHHDWMYGRIRRRRISVSTLHLVLADAVVHLDQRICNEI